MTDPCQLQSFREEKERIKDQNNRILSLYQTFPNDRFSAREVMSHIPDISLNSVRRSITNLCEVGLLVRDGKIKERGKTNNRWRWTGRYEPICKPATEFGLTCCSKCKRPIYGQIPTNGKQMDFYA